MNRESAVPRSANKLYSALRNGPVYVSSSDEKSLAALLREACEKRCDLWFGRVNPLYVRAKNIGYNLSSAVGEYRRWFGSTSLVGIESTFEHLRTQELSPEEMAYRCFTDVPVNTFRSMVRALSEISSEDQDVKDAQVLFAEKSPPSSLILPALERRFRWVLRSGAWKHFRPCVMDVFRVHLKTEKPENAPETRLASVLKEEKKLLDTTKEVLDLGNLVEQRRREADHLEKRLEELRAEIRCIEETGGECVVIEVGQEKKNTDSDLP